MLISLRIYSLIFLSAQVVVTPHRHAGVFIARGKEDALVTKNMVPGVSVYGEKRISVETEDKGKVRFSHLHLHSHLILNTAILLQVEYRVWNPFRSKIAAAILGGVEEIHIKPGAKVTPRVVRKLWLLFMLVNHAYRLNMCLQVLYLGAASGTSVSHVSDLIGPEVLNSFCRFQNFPWPLSHAFCFPGRGVCGRVLASQRARSG